MTRKVVDASVAVKWLLREEHERAARRLLNPVYQLLAPELIWPEVGNVMWKRWRRGELDSATAVILLRTFERFPVTLVTMRGRSTRALILAEETERTVYDCTYLALAQANGCQLVTADERFYNAMRRTPYAGMLLWVEEVEEVGAGNVL